MCQSRARAVGLRATIRSALDSDLAAVESLLEASSLPAAGAPEAIGGFLLAEAQGAIIGVVGMEYCGEYGLLRSTAVAPAWRGRGVARRLVEQIIAVAEARGIRALYLLTTTAETYFPSFGFQNTERETVPREIQVTEEFRVACPASATVMCLRIAA